MQKKNEDIKVTITMLVSNRIDTIRKCMDSIKPILRQVPSELIVVDTGSTDGSIDVVKEYTDKIISFKWCNDFSKARNAGLAGASGEWIMSLDDDEWFEDVSEIVDFFNSGEYKKYKKAAYIARNYINHEGSFWSDSYAHRMVEHKPETCYVGKVHEYITPQQEPVKFFKAYVHHYGYVFDSEEEHKRHSRRNITLLKEELEQQPEDIRILAQLVQEYYALKEPQYMLDLCHKVRNIYERYQEYPVYAGYCYNFSLRAYIQMQDWKAAYDWGKKILAEGAPTSMALLGTVREMILVCKNSGNYRDGLNCLHKYWELYAQLKETVNPEEVFLDLSKYLKKQDHDYVYMEGIALGVLANDWKTAMECLHLADWDSEPLVLYPDTLDFVMELWSKCDVTQEYASILDRLLARPMVYEQISQNMEKYKAENSLQYKKLLYLFTVCQNSSPYANRYRLDYFMQYGKETDRPQICKLVKQLWEKDSNPLLWEKRMWSLLHKEKISVSEEIKGTGLTDWFIQVRGWLEENVWKEGEWDEAYTVVCRDNEQEGMRLRFWELKHGEGTMRRKLREQEAERMDSQWILNSLDGFYSGMWKFFACIYREEMFEYDTATVLPPEAAFAVYIRLAAQRRREGDNEGYLKMLPKAAECYPPMKEWCKVLLEKEKEERLNGRTHAEEIEFQILAREMKRKVRELLDTGNRDTAMQVMTQLEQLLPGDTELMELMAQANTIIR